MIFFAVLFISGPLHGKFSFSFTDPDTHDPAWSDDQNDHHEYQPANSCDGPAEIDGNKSVEQRV